MTPRTNPILQAAASIAYMAVSAIAAWLVMLVCVGIPFYLLCLALAELARALAPTTTP